MDAGFYDDTPEFSAKSQKCGKIEQLCKIGEVNVWHHNGDYFVSLKSCDIKDGDVLISTFGKGKDVESACKDYFNKR